MITLTLPFPPTGNNIYPTARNGRRFLSEKGKAYHAAVHAAVLTQLGKYPRLAHGLSVTYGISAPDKRRRDIANSEKALSDALTKANVWLDDSQIDELRLVRCANVPGGAVVVWIKDIRESIGLKP